jgi:hypothetical protein
LKPPALPRWTAASRPAVLAAVAALVLAVVGPASAQSSSGWKRSGSRPTRSIPAASRTRAALPPERGVFYSNLGLLDSISRETVSAIADSLALAPGSAITLLSSTPHEANWFVGNLLAETLADRGYKVHVGDWGSAPSGGASSSPSSPGQSGSSRPNRPRQGNRQNQPQGPTPASGSDSRKDGEAPADTVGTNPDSTKAASDSLPDRSEEKMRGAEATGTEPPGRELPAGEPSATRPEPPSGSTVPPALGEVQPMASAEPPAGEVLDLRIVEFGVKYSDIGRKLLFGPVRFTRVGGVYIQVSSLKRPEGELHQILSAERHRVDRLSGSQRSLAEGASYPFSAPELKPPGLGRYIEPTVVVGIVSSLVYLFYANQSGK